MIELKKVYPDDFEKVYPILLEFNNPKISKELWKKFLFSNYWKVDNAFSGTILSDGKDVVGFLGYIFYNREINNEMFKFCNFSSWIVKKEYRKDYSMLVWDPIKELTDFTLVGLSPTKTAYRREKSIGFMDLETACSIILPIGPVPKYFSNKVGLIIQRSAIEKVLPTAQLKIYNDHIEFDKFTHCVISTPDGLVYIIYQKTLRKRFPFNRIIYISNINLFNDYLDYIKLIFFRRLKVAGLIVDNRFLKNQNNKFAINQKYSIPNIYMSWKLKPDNIDYLYTEMFLLYNYI